MDFLVLHLKTILRALSFVLPSQGSQSENAKKYEDTSCSSLKRLFSDAMNPIGGFVDQETSASEPSLK